MAKLRLTLVRVGMSANTHKHARDVTSLSARHLHVVQQASDLYTNRPHRIQRNCKVDRFEFSSKTTPAGPVSALEIRESVPRCVISLTQKVAIYSCHRHVGLAVTTRAADPGFDSRLREIYFWVGSYQ